MPRFSSSSRVLALEFFSELLGTALFTLLGTVGGGPVVNGIVLMLCVHATGPLSGGYLNPALSLGAYFASRLTLPTLVIHIAAQVAGGGAGASLAALIHPPQACPLPNPSRDAFLFEMLGTIPLIMAVFTPTIPQPMRPLMIGLGLAVGIMIAGDDGSGLLNPARALLPGLLSWSCAWDAVMTQALASLIPGVSMGMCLCACLGMTHSGESNTLV